MPARRYWTSYWRAKYWPENPEGEPLRFSGGSFTKRGVSPGDAVYVVSLHRGQLLLGGRMTVDKIVSREEAMRHHKRSDLYDAGEWICARAGSGTPLHHKRILARDISKQLRFESGWSELLFVDNHALDRQTLRTVRELTEESAGLLDEIIQETDKRRPITPIIMTLQALLKRRAGK